MTTYREWLGAEHRSNDLTALTDYIAGLVRDEGWRSEFKAATRDVNYGVREAVCAFANSRGGEVFVGVKDDGSVEGTGVKEQRLNETLRQPRADRSDWFETDLMNVSDVLAIPFPSGDRWAFVVEVRGPDRPVFVFDDGRYQMVGRSGSDTVIVDSRGSIQWFKEWRRSDVLRSCYAELSQYSSQLSLFRSLPDGLPDRLPFITAACQDGTFYRLLTEEDRTRLVGRGIPSQGRFGGAVDLYYGVVTRARASLSRLPVYARGQSLRDLEGLGMEYGNLDHDVTANLASLAQYIRSKGFALATP